MECYFYTYIPTLVIFLTQKADFHLISFKDPPKYKKTKQALQYAALLEIQNNLTLEFLIFIQPLSDIFNYQPVTPLARIN